MGAAKNALALASAVLPASKRVLVGRGIPRVGFLGDSLTDFATTISSTTNWWTTVSYVSWLKWMLGERIDTNASLVFGVASQQADHVLNVQVPQAIAAGIDIACILIGINDVNAGTPPATTVANVRASVAALNNAGISVVLVGPYPASYFNDAKSAIMFELNRQYQLLSRDRTLSCRYINTMNALCSFSNGTNYVQSAYMTPTGTHLNSLGSYVLAQQAYAMLDRELTAQDSALFAMGARDVFDATNHPTGSLNATGDFKSAAGGNIVQQSANNGASGTVPLGWSGGFTGTASTTATVAFATIDDPDVGAIMKNLQVTLGGTADSAVPKVDTTVTPVTGLNAGDKIYASCRVKWSNLAGVKEVNATLEVFSGGATLDYEAGQAPITSPDGTTDVPGPLPATLARWLYLTTDPVTLPTGYTSIRLRIYFRLISGATVTGTVLLSQCFIRKAV